MSTEIYKNLNIEDIENEEWKPIPNYELIYYCSNLGRIKSIDKFVKNNGTDVFKKSFIKSQNLYKGYCRVDLNKKSLLAHRIVGLVWLKNFKDSLEINHKSGIKTDNRVLNLECVTHQENMSHAVKTGLIGKGEKHSGYGKVSPNRGGKNTQAISVIQYSTNGEYLKKWDCMNDVERDLKISACNITGCCKLKYKTAGGFQWRFWSQCKENVLILPYTNVDYKPINQFDLFGILLKRWEGATQASRELGITRSSIQRCKKEKRLTAGGYFWQYSSLGNELKVTNKMVQIINKHRDAQKIVYDTYP